MKIGDADKFVLQYTYIYIQVRGMSHRLNLINDATTTDDKVTLKTVLNTF